MAESRHAQDELEKPAKGYQLLEVSNKVDSLAESLAEVKQMIAAQNTTYMSRTEIALEFEKRDNKISELRKNLGTYNKVVWAVVSALIPVIALIIWNVVVNNARVNP